MGEKIKVIFVDDEEKILSGLKRMLRAKRTEWDMDFFTSGEEALGMMAEAPADVIISDMRMPGMDGAQVLTLVHISQFLCCGETNQNFMDEPASEKLDQEYLTDLALDHRLPAWAEIAKNFFVREAA